MVAQWWVLRAAKREGLIVMPDGQGGDEVFAGWLIVSRLSERDALLVFSVGGGSLAMALAAGSFTDGTRVAGSRLELVRAMCEGNRDALLAAVDDALGRLGAARGSLASTGGLAATIQAGHLARQTFDAARDTARGTTEHIDTVHIDLTAPNALARLRDIGHQGARVTALPDPPCHVTL